MSGITTVRIALVGDRDESVLAHQAIPKALALAGAELGIAVDADWLATESLTRDDLLGPYHGIWCVPASPYRSMAGALRAITFARRSPSAFLGTCGGFQHALLEYARNVLHWHDAEHAEIAPESGRHIIAALECDLVEKSEICTLLPGSRLAAAYGGETITEGYHCRFGVNPVFREAVLARGLVATATTAAGDVRAVELLRHPFFVATLFQPERAALRDELPPVVRAFVKSAHDMYLRDRMIERAYPDIEKIANALIRARPGSTALAASLVDEGLHQSRWVQFNDEEHLRRYLRIVMRGELHHRWVNRQQRNAALEIIAAESDGITTPDLEHTSRMIDYQQALSELAAMDPAQAEIVRRHELDDETFPQIVLATGIGLTTVNKEYKMAVAWLKARLSRDR